MTTKTLADLIGTRSPIDETHELAWIEWGSLPTVVWNENLKFHFELRWPDPAERAQQLAEVRALIGINDRLRAFNKYLNTLLPQNFTSLVQWAKLPDEDGYPYLELAAWRTKFKPMPRLGINWTPDWMPLDTTEEDAFNRLWPVIATLFNITDPGTYNSPYLFGRF